MSYLAPPSTHVFRVGSVCFYVCVVYVFDLLVTIIRMVTI